jgi:hypothetical protein
MGFLDNAVNKSVPQGSSLAKPLLLAFGALLASGALTGALTRKQAPTPAPGTSPAADPQAGGSSVAERRDRAPAGRQRSA